MNTPPFDSRAADGVLPPYAPATVALEKALAALAPPVRISVAEAAETYRRLDSLSYRGPWVNATAPYMVEPMEALTSRRFGAAVFVGPARCLKTDALIINTIVHRVTCQPRNMLVVHMTQESARDFSLEKLAPMIRACPEVAVRQAAGKGADNIFDKRFVAGMRLSIGWPVISKLSARDLPDVLFSDYDRMPESVDGEGEPFDLGRKRNQTFGTRGKTVAESSPGRPILDESWRPSSPHQAPPATGILALYNRGTRGRLYWTCPDCGRIFEPSFHLLDWDDKAKNAPVAHNVVLVCPECGVTIPQEARHALNAGAQWLHEGRDGELVPIDGAVRETDVASWWVKGPAAVFQNWREIVQRWLDARTELELTGSEGSLQTTVNVDQGEPYLPQALGEAGQLSEAFLEGRSRAYTLGVAPAETRFVTVQVDVQGNRFVVQVDAWGVGLERWLIDRFDLHTPPADAPGAEKRALRPAHFVEDWAVLDGLFERVWPVDGTGYGLKPAAIAIDSGGEPGVTERAYAFYRRIRKAGLGGRLRLIRPVGGLRIADRAIERVPEQENRKKRVKSDLVLLHVATDRIKDEVAAALTRPEPGPGAYHLPAALPKSVFAEFCAERRGPKGWERKAGGRRNEALDLAVYGKGLVIAMKAEKMDWAEPKGWAAPVAANRFAVALDGRTTPPPTLAPPRRSRRVLSRGVS